MAGRMYAIACVVVFGAVFLGTVVSGELLSLLLMGGMALLVSLWSAQAARKKYRG